MLSLSRSRFLSTSTMQSAALKRVRAKDFVRERLFHRHSTTGSAASSSILFSFDPRRREEERTHQKSVYQRAMPRVSVNNKSMMGGLILPPPPTTHTAARWFSSTTEAARDASYRQRVKDRASHMRNSARQSYQDFREHPGESMRSGAKSFSGMMRRYGPVLVGTYAGVYLTTLGTFFVGVQSGLLDPAYLFSLFGHVDAGEAKNTVDLVVDWMKNHTITEPYVPFMERNPYLANFAVAWIAVKFTEPIRAAISLGITPRVARALGYASKEDDPVEEESSEKDAETVETTTKDADGPGDKKA